jgi:hypoxanthine-guanine phosphoribosyltransferase
MKNKSIAILMIIISTGLMQVHSITFWEGQVDQIGWAWSIALEAAMLWLWYEKKLLPLRLLAAAILIAGPWYQMTAPAMEKLHSYSSLKIQEVDYQEEVLQLFSSHKRYDDNSKKKYGWAKRIDNTQIKLDTARHNLREVRKKISSLPIPWRLYLVTVMQAAVLFVVMVTQLLAVTKLRIVTVTRKTTVTGKTVKPSNVKTNLTVDSQFVDRVVVVCRNVMKKNGLSQSKLAQKTGVRPADISMLFKHKEKLANNEETISDKQFGKLVSSLGIEA